MVFPVRERGKSPKILVVDDDDGLRELLTEVLTQNRPYEVDEAANGIKACIKLGSDRPDLLILDLYMPEMDGLEVCRTIKTDPELADLKVIITTGYVEHRMVDDVEKMGFTNILYKPFDFKQFLELVDAALA